jgi:hypothetical protein
MYASGLLTEKQVGALAGSGPAAAK